jgi:hypothetical protein
MYNIGGKQDSQKTFTREMERPQKVVEPVNADSGFGRSDLSRKELPEPQKASSNFRVGLSEDEVGIVIIEKLY